MGDPDFGNRDPVTGVPTGHDRWTRWDYALITAYQMIQDWTDQHGNLVYEVNDEKERVIVHAEKKIDQFEAQKTLRTGGQNYKPTPGEYFIPKLELRHGATWPTLEEYVENELKKKEEAGEELPLPEPETI